MVYFYGANMAGYVEGAPLNPVPGRTTWFGPFCFDSSELPNITIYAMYIPMFIMWMKKEKDEKAFKRFILPIAAILCCAFMVYAAVYAHGITPYLAAKADGKFSLPALFYLIVYAVIMFIGKLAMGKRSPIEE